MSLLLLVQRSVQKKTLHLHLHLHSHSHSQSQSQSQSHLLLLMLLLLQNRRWIGSIGSITTLVMADVQVHELQKRPCGFLWGRCPNRLAAAWPCIGRDAEIMGVSC